MDTVKATLIHLIKRKEALPGLILLISGLSFLGWFTNRMGLAAYSLNYIPIAPSTASIFIILSILFILDLDLGKSRIAKRFVATAVFLSAMFCLSIFLDYLFNFSWDIEQVFISNPEKMGTIPIGRMSPITSLLFFFTCISFFELKSFSSPLSKYLAGSTSLLVFITSAILLIGYMYKAPLLYGSQTIPVALPTAICFLLISLTLLRQFDLKYWTFNLINENRATFQLLSIFLPVVISIVLLQGFLDSIFVFNDINPALSEALNILVVVAITIFVVIKISDILGGRFLKAEQALKDSETKFREFFEANSDGIAIFTFNQDTDAAHFLDMNENSAKMLGYTREEMLVMNPSDFEKLITGKELEGRIEELKARGSSEFETKLRHKNGSDVEVEIKARVINYNNRPVLMNIVRDITERKRIEEALKVWNIKFKKLSLQAPGLIFQFTRRPDGSYFVPIASEGIRDIFGCSPEDVLEDFSPIARVLYPEDTERVVAEIEYSAKHLTFFTCEFRVQIPGREIQWIQSKSKPEKLPDGSVTWYGFNNDITQSKILEQELTLAKDKAEESDRLKSAFLANMSHEIRTPMNGILGFAELLREPDLSVEEQQDFIRTIGESGERMLNTLNDIIDFSKIESGMMKIDNKESDINEQMEFIHKFFEPEVERNGIKLVFKRKLPSGEAVIKTDIEKIYAILTNLVKNAIKFTHQGSIEFGCEKKGKFLEFFVKDTGIGIPAKLKGVIFERFRQVSESLERSYEGAGLGLAISQSYVEMLGGKIWVESEERKGSVFYFTIPYNSVSEEKIIIRKDASETERESTFRKLKILVAEDDIISNNLINRVIHEFSYEVIFARTGFETVVACHNNRDIDLILMDIRMPDMDGYEATLQIRQFNKDVIIIAQTAYAFSSDREMALEVGCNDYISKPISKTLLIELIKKHFSI